MKPPFKVRYRVPIKNQDPGLTYNRHYPMVREERDVHRIVWWHVINDEGRVERYQARKFEMVFTDEILEQLWEELEDIPFEELEDGEPGELYLSINWQGFFKGTSRQDIWEWFDELHSKGVSWLLNEYEPE